MDPRRQLSRRERQIVDAVYRLGEASVAQVRAQMHDPPGYDAVRTTMRLLEEKGVLRHRRDGQRYVYRTTVEKGHARQNALADLVRTFFDGSARAAALALLQLEDEAHTEDAHDALTRQLERDPDREDDT